MSADQARRPDLGGRLAPPSLRGEALHTLYRLHAQFSPCVGMLRLHSHLEQYTCKSCVNSGCILASGLDSEERCPIRCWRSHAELNQSSAVAFASAWSHSILWICGQGRVCREAEGCCNCWGCPCEGPARSPEIFAIIISKREGDSSSAGGVYASDLYQLCFLAKRCCRWASSKGPLHSMASNIGAWQGLRSEQRAHVRHACPCWNHSIVLTQYCLVLADYMTNHFHIACRSAIMWIRPHQQAHAPPALWGESAP